MPGVLACLHSLPLFAQRLAYHRSTLFTSSFAPRCLDTQNNFERGQKDEFEVTGSDVGQIQRIIIGHDNSGQGI